MKTLHEHSREMLHAIKEQSKIPNTKLNGDVWIAYDGGPVCSMNAVGAWFAQKYNRRDAIRIDSFSGAIYDAMLVIDSLSRFKIEQAHNRLYWRDMTLAVPNDIAGGDSVAMDADWQAAQEKLLVWLTEHNI